MNLLKEWDLHTTKPPKRHIKHELDAHLSTSKTLVHTPSLLSSPLVSFKYIFVKVRCSPLRIFMYGVLVFFNALTS